MAAAAQPAGPLAGVKVLELSVAIAGPATAGMLADWGASVTRVEFGRGDPIRNVYTALRLPGLDAANPVQMGPGFFVDNRGKRSVVLDLKDAAGRDAFEKLLAVSDVFVTNYRVEALTRLGLNPEQVASRHPTMVVGLITGYGRTGSDDDKMQAYEPSAFWARSGAADAHRYENEAYPPMLSGGFGDHATALSCAGGICAALVQARSSGQGMVVETSLFRTAIYLNAWPFGFGEHCLPERRCIFFPQ
jgi:crotonobetainyl-CoA:carnitine CoA-transferase CaiB-like acyl-CoA transferase